MFFFFKQKTAYEMRISDWSSDVCSSDLEAEHLQRIRQQGGPVHRSRVGERGRRHCSSSRRRFFREETGRNPAGIRATASRCLYLARIDRGLSFDHVGSPPLSGIGEGILRKGRRPRFRRSEEHTSELQSLMRISYAVFCLKKKKKIN